MKVFKKFAVLLAIAALLSVICVISTSAAETSAPDIYAANLSFEDAVYIMYAVDTEGLPADQVKMLFWTSPILEGDAEAYVKGTENYEFSAYGETVIKEKTYKTFKYNKLRAKNMTDYVYARAYVEVDGVAYYSELSKYSILQYAYNKLGYTGTATTNANLQELLTTMLAHGAAAQKYFKYNTDRLATDSFYRIKLEEGIFSDGSNHGLYLAGEQVTITAGIDDFVCWIDAFGYTATTESTATVLVCEANNTYTASPTLGEEYIGSIGLMYEINEDGESYTVTGYGLCTDTHLVIPATYMGKPVTAIGKEAFLNKGNITSVTIPGSIVTIGEGAFKSCRKLTAVTIEDGVSVIGQRAFWECKALTSITIGNGVTTIGQAAFYYCDGLSAISLPNSVTTIEDRAFWYCHGLTAMTIPSSVTTIGDEAFEYCSSLASVNIPAGVTVLGDEIFSECTNLSSVTIENGVTEIPRGMFKLCSSLTSITLPESVTSIGDVSFHGCSSLTSITIGDSVTTIGDQAFEYCSSLASVTIGDGVTSIGTGAFNGCSSLAAIRIPSGVTTIEPWVFMGCSSLTSVTIPEGVKSIKNDAFKHCTGLTTVIISEGTTYLGERAFYGCSNLSSILIPSSMYSIKQRAFEGCDNLTTVYYCGIFKDWEDLLNRAEKYNEPLKNATFCYYSELPPTDAGNYWHWVDGVPTKW